MLEQAGPEVARLGGRVLLAGEEWLLAKWRKRLIQGLIQEGLELSLAPFQGECCESSVQALSDKARGFEVLAALGGGKCLDTAKLAAARLKLPLVTIPSSAATCACASPISVRYDAEGVYQDIEDLPKAADLCLVDYGLIASAGPRLLSAGMADTLAKFLELPEDADAAFGANPGRLMAQHAFRVVSEFGKEALACQGAAFEAVLEANLLTSALASSLGGATAMAAHSFCNGLSLLPEFRTWLHGELVGAGLLFQEACFRELGADPPDGHAGVKPLLGSWGLPVRLPGKGLEGEALEGVCQKILAGEETIDLAPRSR